jgi:hypothetical protein
LGSVENLFKPVVRLFLKLFGGGLGAGPVRDDLGDTELERDKLLLGLGRSSSNETRAPLSEDGDFMLFRPSIQEDRSLWVCFDLDGELDCDNDNEEVESSSCSHCSFVSAALGASSSS